MKTKKQENVELDDEEDDILEEKMNEIRELWEKKKFKTPKILLGKYKDDYYLVSDDSIPVIHFIAINQDIRKRRTYAAVKSKCHKKKLGNVSYYEIEDGALNVISGSKPLYETGNFVSRKLVDVIL